jgi:hypothetical protein
MNSFWISRYLKTVWDFMKEAIPWLLLIVLVIFIGWGFYNFINFIISDQSGPCRDLQSFANRYNEYKQNPDIRKLGLSITSDNVITQDECEQMDHAIDNIINLDYQHKVSNWVKQS